MSRCSTAASAKRGGRDYLNKRDEPRPGTKIREIYDLFWANRGRPIKWIGCNQTEYMHHSSRLEYLKSSYGLDIRRLRNGTWILAGEWVGKGYVDYTVDVLPS